MSLIGVIDHGAGNLVSISQGLERVGASVRLASLPSDLDGCDAIVLPGVGSSGGVMEGIRSGGFETVIRKETRPLLGICVGMQVLFETSEEDGARCLGLIPGTIRRLNNAPRLPHIGWNEVEVVTSDPIFASCPNPVEMYFVHSFAPVPDDRSVVIATARHGDPFVAAVRSENLVGTQFHPERSSAAGLSILEGFVASVTAGLGVESGTR